MYYPQDSVQRFYGCQRMLQSKNNSSLVLTTFQICDALKYRLIFEIDIQNQIYYILCTQRRRSSVQSAKTRLGADCGSDHELLIAKFRLNFDNTDD